MRVFVWLLGLCLVVNANATDLSVASVGYVVHTVDEATNTKVDTSEKSNQTMAGSYTVSGTLIVPTPPLPSAG